MVIYFSIYLGMTIYTYISLLLCGVGGSKGSAPWLLKKILFVIVYLDELGFMTEKKPPYGPYVYKVTIGKWRF